LPAQIAFVQTCLVEGKIVLAVICLMTQNKHCLLPLPKFNKAVPILRHQAKGAILPLGEPNWLVM